jgi:hypothetical protein
MALTDTLLTALKSPDTAMQLQGAGALMGAVGAFTSANSQKMALDQQAQLDMINARATASSLNATANIDNVNADATYNAALTNSGLAVLSAKSGFNAVTTGAELDKIGAQGSFNASIAQAGMDVIGGQGQALTIRTNAAVDAIKAGSTVAALNVGAQISDNAAHLNELQAQAAMMQGQYQEQQTQLQGAAVKSKQTARMAASGIDLGEGSALNVVNSTDLMTQRAAIDIEQRTALAVFASRASEAGAMADAAQKRFQAGSVSISSSLETGLSESQANAVVANTNAQADLRKALAGIGLTTATAAANAKEAYAGADLTRATASADAQRALALAGLTNANAAADMKRVMAQTTLLNASGASKVKSATAAGISPFLSATTSLLTSAGQVAGGWYQLSKAQGKTA